MVGVLLALLVQEQEAVPYRRDRLEPAVRRSDQDGLFFNDLPAALRGATIVARAVAGRDLDAEFSDLLELVDNGTASPFSSRFTFDELEFQAFEAGLGVDFDLFRASAAFMSGDWEGKGTLTVDDGFLSGVQNVSTRSLDVEGDLIGMKFALEWPLLRMRSGPIETSLGPEAAAIWLHLDPDPVPASPLPFDDEPDLLVGSISPKLRFRYFAGALEVSLEVAASYFFADALGWGAEVGLEIGLRF
jgi:hypothetical protein